MLKVPRKKEVWIGLVDTVPKNPENKPLSEGMKGAFVNALALVGSAEEFISSVTRGLDDIGLLVVEIENVEPPRLRLQHATIEELLHDRAESVERFGSVEFGTFHNYRTDDLSH